MATSFILVLLLVTIVFLLVRHIKTGTATLLFTLICFLLIGEGFLPSLLLKRLQMPFVDLPQPRWGNKNAIVLLGAGTFKLPISQWH